MTSQVLKAKLLKMNEVGLFFFFFKCRILFKLQLSLSWQYCRLGCEARLSLKQDPTQIDVVNSRSSFVPIYFLGVCLWYQINPDSTPLNVMGEVLLTGWIPGTELNFFFFSALGLKIHNIGTCIEDGIFQPPFFFFLLALFKVNEM